MLGDCNRRSVRIRCWDWHHGKQIDVACSGEMLPTNAEVTDGHCVIVTKLPLHVQTPLMRHGLYVVRRERINVDHATHSGGRSRKNVRIAWEVRSECIG